MLNKGGTELQYKTQWQGQIYPWCNSLMSAELNQRWNRLATCTWNTPVSTEGYSYILQPEGTVMIISSDFLHKHRRENCTHFPITHSDDWPKDFIPFTLAGGLLWFCYRKMLQCWASPPCPDGSSRFCSISLCLVRHCRGWRQRMKRAFCAPSLWTLPLWGVLPVTQTCCSSRQGGLRLI